MSQSDSFDSIDAEAGAEAVPALPEYAKIADQFSVSAWKTYLGPVVISEEAMFLTPMQNAAAVAASTQLGLLGFALDWLLTRHGKIGGEHPLLIDYERLPETISKDPSWPVKKHKGRLFLVPKTIVINLSSSRWGALKVETRNQVFTISLPAFGRKKIRQVLADYGWAPS